MARPDHEYRALITELKRILKQRRITYKDLAGRLGISEAGVKRIFLKSDGKISTLSKICDALGFTFTDLVAASRLGSTKVQYLSSKQDEFLARNFDCYVFFNELVIRKKSVSQIQMDHGLNAHSARKYLRALEQLDLIELKSDDRIKLLIQEPVGFVSNGKLRHAIQSHFVRSVAARLTTLHLAKSEDLLCTREWTLSATNFKSFREDIHRLVERYDQIGARDHALLEPSDLITTNLLLGLTLDHSPYPSIRKIAPLER